MRKMTITQLAEELGFSEPALTHVLRYVVGLPFEIRQGRIVADPEELSEALAERGIVVPAMFATNPNDEDGKTEDEEDGEEEDEEEETDAPPRRRR